MKYLLIFAVLVSSTSFAQGRNANYVETMSGVSVLETLHILFSRYDMTHGELFVDGVRSGTCTVDEVEADQETAVWILDQDQNPVGSVLIHVLKEYDWLTFDTKGGSADCLRSSGKVARPQWLVY